jgi:hypothetical protein
MNDSFGPLNQIAAPSYDKPDHFAIVIHNYLWRLGLTEGKSKYDDLGDRLARIISCVIGHNLPQESPQAFADAIVEVDSCAK